MPKYLCMQRRLKGGGDEKPSPSQMQEMYAKFGAWREKFKDNLADTGRQHGGRFTVVVARRCNVEVASEHYGGWRSRWQSGV